MRETNGLLREELEGLRRRLGRQEKMQESLAVLELEKEVRLGACCTWGTPGVSGPPCACPPEMWKLPGWCRGRSSGPGAAWPHVWVPASWPAVGRLQREPVGPWSRIVVHAGGRGGCPVGRTRPPAVGASRWRRVSASRSRREGQEWVLPESLQEEL